MTKQEFIDAVWQRVRVASDEPAETEGMLRDDTGRLFERGFTISDAVAYLHCVEHVSPDLPEDVALERMKQIEDRRSRRVEEPAMIHDRQTGWTEPTIVINGVELTFAQAMAVRVAINSFRMFCSEAWNRDNLGWRLADGYNERLGEVEAFMRTR